MEYFLKSLTDNSNLILIILNLVLVLVTGIYAFLTYRMVLEMKKARENQSDSNLIASPVSYGPIYAQVQLENIGPGPALDIELLISLDPPLETKVKLWRHPALSVGQKEHFLIPQDHEGSLDALQQLAEKHTNLKINLKWKNIFGHDKSSSTVYNLKDLADGWYNAGNLVKPEDLPTQIQKVAKSLDEIHRDVEKIGKNLNSQHHMEMAKKNADTKTKISRKKKAK